MSAKLILHSLVLASCSSFLVANSHKNHKSISWSLPVEVAIKESGISNRTTTQPPQPPNQADQLATGFISSDPRSVDLSETIRQIMNLPQAATTESANKNSWSPLVVENSRRPPSASLEPMVLRRRLAPRDVGRWPLKNKQQIPVSNKRTYSVESEMNSMGTNLKQATFDDTVDLVATKQAPYEQAGARHGLTLSLAPRPSQQLVASATADDELISSLVENLLLAQANGVGRYNIPVASHQRPSLVKYHHYQPHHLNLPSQSRKSLEKSLSLPIMVGTGAALITFLILSNLFLSIPLLAMTLAHLFNGNNGNQNLVIPPSSNNSNQAPQQPSAGRKKRRKRATLEEVHILEALHGFVDKQNW